MLPVSARLFAYLKKYPVFVQQCNIFLKWAEDYIAVQFPPVMMLLLFLHEMHGFLHRYEITVSVTVTGLDKSNRTKVKKTTSSAAIMGEDVAN